MLEAKEISKAYNDRCIIDKISIVINKGDFVSITGESGKGKTTLLNILGLLEKPSGGELSIEGIESPSRHQIMSIQRNLYAYLFQNYALIENETVESNLNIALEYRKGINKKKEIDRALAYVNLDGFANKRIYELSGGEQQRVALARVFVKKCSYIFADEPTGNLDKHNSDIVFDILKKLNDMGKAVIFATHDIEMAQKAEKQIVL